MQARKIVAALILGVAVTSAWAQDKVVYHIADSASQALAGLRSMRNHLDTDPSAKITVVAIGEGVDFLMEGAKDRNGSSFAGPISALTGRGVKFEVCEITLTAREMNKNQFLQEADFTPSGVVRLTKLQHQGFAYIRP